MSLVARLAALGHSFLDQFGGLKVQASLDAEDLQQYSGAAWMAPICVTGMPYGPSANDGAEGILIDRVGPYSGIVIAARDRRGAKIYGQLSPGDGCLHTTGPDACTQVLVKRENNIASILTKDTKDKTCGIIVQGTGGGEAITVLAFGHVIQITRDQGIVMSSRNGLHGLTISDDGVHVKGNVVLGGSNPVPGMALMMGPVAGQPPGPAAVLLVPALGVSIGA